MSRRLLFGLVLVSVYCLLGVGMAGAYELVVGKCTANLESATSNNVSVSWYVPLAPDVGATVSDNTLDLAMSYQFRDDSVIAGKEQRAQFLAFAWDPTNYTWVFQDSRSEWKGYTRPGRYDVNGKISARMSAWSSSSNAVKFKVEASAASGDKSTVNTGYIWVVRSSVQGNSNRALYRWMCSRFDRSAMYKEMANAWRSMQSAPSGENFKKAMDQIIDISKEFVNSTAADLGFDLGTESLSLLAGGSALASALSEVNGVLVQAIGWVNTASNLLGPGLKSAIATAVSGDMIKAAVASASGLAGMLDQVADAVRADAYAMGGVLYGGGSSFSWRDQMVQERDKINEALSAVSNARSAIANYLSPYTSTYSTLPYGAGGGLSSAAQAVSSRLNEFLDGVQNQLTMDKNLLDKMIR